MIIVFLDAFLFGLSASLAGCSEGRGPETMFPQGVEVDIISQNGESEGKESARREEKTDGEKSPSQGSGTGQDRKDPSAQGAELLQE